MDPSAEPDVLVPRAKQVVDLRTQVYSAWTRDPNAAADICLQRNTPTTDGLRQASEIRDIILALLAEAHLWWIDPDMCAVIEAVAPSMPDVNPDPPSDVGLAVFARPVRGTDAEAGDEISTTAYLWGPIELNGVLSIIFATFEHRLRLESILGRERLILSQHAHHLATTLTFTGWSSWPVDALTSETDIEGEHQRVSYIEDRRAMAAVWGIVASPGVASEPEMVDRPARRRAQRAGLQVPDQSVRVVRLHAGDYQAHPRAGAAMPVEWSHRWLVSGHWRQQWYPSRGQHLAKYILPHVKGPADKPLIVKDTVRAIVP